MKRIITILNKSKLYNKIDIRFAEFISKLNGNEAEPLFLSAALLSRVTGGGDICLDLNRYARQVIFTDPDNCEETACPALPDWLKILKSCDVVGAPGEFKPLILDVKNRLYLYRYWNYQKMLADAVKYKAASQMDDINPAVLKRGLKRFFNATVPDWQQIAAIAAVLNRFCVISGGPGTGKTHLIAIILALLLEQAGGSGMRIFLAAPTGKAAVKLSETIKQVAGTLPCPDAIIDLIPTEAVTIHRLLKPLPHSPYFHYCKENPLPADVVVVDEASMIDLALMSKLFLAISDEARLILVGDRDQLASVEPGSVLGDIGDPHRFYDFSESFCSRINRLSGVCLNVPDIHVVRGAGLHDNIIALRKNYRFSETGGIGGLSRAIKSGNAVEAVALFDRPEEADIFWEDAFSAGAIRKILERHVLQAYRPYLQAAEPFEALEKLSHFQILCVLNKGPFGVQAVNHLIEEILTGIGVISVPQQPQSPWYRGRPVIITRNDYRLGLYNGDIGITLPDPKHADGSLHVFFPGSRGETRRFIPQQLPEHETVYAMTVHKSQGSEFAKIMLVLPDRDVAVLTRELIYTAVTRAREQVVLCGSKPILQAAVLRGIDRTSGLRDALWHSDHSSHRTGSMA